MASPGERIRDALYAIRDAFIATVGQGNVATAEQLEQLDADIWDAVRAECLPRTAEISLSAAQTARITASNHVEFNQASGPLVDDGLVTLATGVDQANGLVTLAQDHVFRVHATMRPSFSSAAGGNIRSRLVTSAGGSLAGSTPTGVAPHEMRWLSGTNPSLWGEATSTECILTPTSADLVIVADFQSVASILQIEPGARIVITEVQ